MFESIHFKRVYTIEKGEHFMAYMDKRQKNIEIFEDTRAWYTQDAVLQEAVQRTRQGTQFYAPGTIPISEEMLTRYPQTAHVIVSQNRTLQAAQRYAGQKVAVLNFASATNPGGGVTRGSSAQEEALCRCSTLYPCLLGDDLWRKYYQMHRDRHDTTYTDACIYLPDVLVMKTDTDSPQRLPKEDMYRVDVITCAAPNLRERPNNAMNPGSGAAVHLTREQIYALHTQRARKILSAAALHEAEVLILGAFGCGAFCNPPEVVAAAFRDVLPGFAYAFRTVEFAVYCPPRDDSNYRAFQRILQPADGR